MRSVRSTEFDGPHGRVPVRIYTPEGSVSPAPALVWFHGGGMIMGSLESWDHLARALAVASGAVVVNVGYRLAPEHRYPVANDEAYGAVEWVAAQHVSLGLDPARIAVGGDSAGGSLAAATACVRATPGGRRWFSRSWCIPVSSAGRRGSRWSSSRTVPSSARPMWIG